MTRPKLYVYDGQPGLDTIINRLIDLCHEHQGAAADGSYTDIDIIWPSQVLDIIEGRDPS